MRYKIADLITEIPEVGGLPPILREYICAGDEPAQITIDPTRFNPDFYQTKLDETQLAYLESGWQFFGKLMNFGGFYLHSSSVAYEGRAYMFSADSGTGKSTHTRLWQQVFGEDVKRFNDDKAPLRLLDGVWYAYGAPWCGKDNININMKVPVGGICFLKQAKENKIRRLSPSEAATRIVCQTIRQFQRAERVDLMLSHVEKLVQKIPVFEMENRPEPAAVQLSYETMRKAAEELGL